VLESENGFIRQITKTLPYTTTFVRFATNNLQHAKPALCLYCN